MTDIRHHRYSVVTAPARLSFPIAGEFWKAFRRPRPDLAGYGKTAKAAITDLLEQERAEEEAMR